MAAQALKAIRGDDEPKKETPLDDVVKALKSANAADKVKAANALGKLGKSAQPALRELSEAATDKSEEVSRACLVAIQKIDPKLHKGLAAFFATADNDDDQRNVYVDQIVALCHLQQMKGGAKPAVPVILASMEKLKARIRTGGKLQSVALNVLNEVVETLRLIAPDDMDAVKALIALARQPGATYTKLRSSALQSLGAVAAAENTMKEVVFPVLHRALWDEDTRAAAAEGLGKMGPAAKEALPTLNKYKLDSDRAVREAVTEAIKKIEKE